MLAPLASQASAQQVCGPHTFFFGTTGPGCVPPGTGVPTLTTGFPPFQAAPPCTLLLTLAPTLPVAGTISTRFLILGASNPMLDLTASGLPGCTLLAFPDVVAVMPSVPGGTPSTLAVPIPLNLALPAIAYAQGVILANLGGTLPVPLLSNGIQVTIV
ncbi:MAG: hypothetical protein L0323_11825 [Planctomycetes bacterium]|nr:hypothetical protein [Planctomycetota bacterium]